MRTSITAMPTAMLLLATVQAVAQDELDKDQQAIRKAIPAASAMSREDFEKWAQSPAMPKLETVKDRSLTAHLFVMKLQTTESADKRREFRFLTTTPPKPAELATEVARYTRLFGKSFPTGPITFIQPDRIKQFACKVDGNNATGHVVFEAPEMYAGRVKFTASRANETWQITSFSMPARGLKLVRDKKAWKPVKTTRDQKTEKARK